MVPSGSMKNTARTAAVSLSPGWSMPYNFDTCMSRSAMMGNSNSTPVFSCTAFTQAICEWMLSMLRPSSLALCCAKNSFSSAKPVISVVQTGVKSAGWENSTTQLPLLYSESCSCPVVVVTLKSGALSPILGIWVVWGSIVVCFSKVQQIKRA